ncbi:hypothetical protein [Anditalea andensis]|uniref:PepSY domain-containing protein n=1 Tax=Anditalea andensis TaxID=1048983 RepID=A0A074LN93_9BACT|nr:hypothetical protein [Anditalea andensis]KEO75392.1 hypothetical protein EL17_01485 [Anditalea andensis]
MKKKLIYFAAIPLMMMMGACDNQTGTTGEGTNQRDGEAVLEDTSRRTDLNRDRNLDRDRDGATPGTTMRDVERERIESNDVPQDIRTRIDNDASLQNREVTETNRYTRDGITYYEMTLRDNQGQTSTVTYDQHGNRAGQ